MDKTKEREVIDKAPKQLFIGGRGRDASEGRTLEDGNVLLTHIRNGKIAEAWLLNDDQYAADEFFS